MAKVKGKYSYPEPGENRRGISADKGHTYHHADYSPSDVPLGGGLLDETAKLLRKNRDKGMGASKHHKD